jgi:hypothetical protein
MTAMRAYVRAINKREVTVSHKRRGRITGTDTVTVNDGYQATCRACGWVGAVTPYTVVATAQVAGHNDRPCPTIDRTQD